MVLFFHLKQDSQSFLRQAMTQLQDIACVSSQGGLMCTAELHHTIPRWEAWIVAEAKRRTLFTMYLFDSVLSTQEGLPTYLGTELRGLLAPSRSSLWNAPDRRAWDRTYNAHLADWPDAHFRIDELWALEPDADALTVSDRVRRIRLWLEDVDNYGTMMYSITSAAHGI